MEHVEKGEFQEIDGLKNELLGPIKQVEHRGGEGQGTWYYTVMYFEKYDMYVRLSGYYASYDGVDYTGHDYEHVIPEQQIITVYEWT